MKTKRCLPSLILPVCLLLFSSIPVLSQDTDKGGGNNKSIALVSTMIGKISQSPVPLLDAPPFNNKTNSIAPFIIKEEELIINDYRDSVASMLKKSCNCEVLSGNTLTTNPGYQDIIKKFNFPENLKTNDENFPNIIIPKDEVNIFNFDDTRNFKVINYLINAEKTKNTTSEICKLLGTDFVAVFFSNISITKYGMFGGHAQLGLYTIICIYNEEGKLICKAWIYKPMRTIRASGDNVLDYRAVLVTLGDYLDKLTGRVAKKMK
jgi:hypothetical protein